MIIIFEYARGFVKYKSQKALKTLTEFGKAFDMEIKSPVRNVKFANSDKYKHLPIRFSKNTDDV